MSKSRASNGQGHTYKDGNSWRTVIHSNGRVISASASTRQESRRRAKEKATAIAGLPVTRGEARSFHVGTFLNHWLEDRKASLAHSTYLRYKGLIQHYLAPSLGKISLARLTKHDVSRLLSGMAAAGQSPRSRQQARAVLSAAMHAAVEAELIPSNPVDHVKRIKIAKKPITPLTLEEVRTLLNFATGTPLLARLHIGLLCGLRQGEALGLRWRDLDLDSGTLRVQVQIQKIDGTRQFVDLKTDSAHRLIMLPASTVQALKDHRVMQLEARLQAGPAWEDHDLVFPNRFGKPLQSKTDYSRWIRALNAAGIASRSLHNARHTAGTLMYAEGIDIETIRRVLGHSTIALTSSTYLHTAEPPMRAAADKLNSALGFVAN